ncbi:amidophosphoribosyltransferase, partial [Streptomyces coelicoflavus ZG0656]
RQQDAGRDARLLEVDSLGFLSIDGLYRAMGETGRNNDAPQFTDHYFTGDYPTRLLDREIEEGGREFSARQLSLLVSA